VKYRKKPTEVDAIQWTGHNWKEVAEFLGGRVELSSLSAVIIDTHDGLETHVEPYDWIICDEQGRIDGCRPHTFSDLYEVENDA
jgi:hypothetical protein